jgi:hypothetical protein
MKRQRRQKIFIEEIQTSRKKLKYIQEIYLRWRRRPYYAVALA